MKQKQTKALRHLEFVNFRVEIWEQGWGSHTVIDFWGCFYSILLLMSGYFSTLYYYSALYYYWLLRIFPLYTIILPYTIIQKVRVLEVEVKLNLLIGKDVQYFFNKYTVWHSYNRLHIKQILIFQEQSDTCMYVWRSYNLTRHFK